MRCPACDGNIDDSAWICPLCERILDASFLGNDITNDISDIDPPMAIDPPTDGLDVDAQMIVSTLEEEPIPEPPTDDLGPVAKEVEPLGGPPADKIDTNILPEQVLPTTGLKPLDPSLLQEIPAEPPKPRGMPPLKKKSPSRARSAALERPRREPDRPREAAVVVRSTKAEKLFQQALEDAEAGNLVSARTNIKLALTFDPGNTRYAEKLNEVEQAAGPTISQDLEEVPKGVQFANQFYEKAIDQENQGHFDEAIKLLEKAIRADPQGVYYHRLGSILAFQQGKLKEGRTMVDKAIQRSPRNKNYQKTLSRILEKMNGGEERKNMSNMLGGLLKRK